MSEPARPARPGPGRGDDLRYVALGDSYTIGTAVAAGDAWPDQLVARLAADPPARTLRLVANHAVNGSTASAVIRGQLPRLADDGPVGYASLLVGVNDAVQGVGERAFRADAATILDALLAHLAPRRILVVETPDYTVTPMGAAFGDPGERSAAIERFNAVLAGLCAERRIPFIDGILAISREAAVDPSLVTSDGLHPSASQYRRWVGERIEPVVRGLLGHD